MQQQTPAPPQQQPQLSNAAEPSSSPVHTPSQPIRLLTQNMWLINTLRGKEPPLKHERSHDFAQHLKNYDIICMQEVFSVGDFGLIFDSSFKDYFLKQGANVGLKYAAVPPEVCVTNNYKVLRLR